MTDTENGYRFERSHEILINAEPSQVLDYVSNPHSWPQWIMASHHIESDDKPTKKGDRFRELWQTRTGQAELNWLVTEREDARLWVGETHTDFIGKIVVRYDVERVGSQTRFVRTVTNPARPKPITQKMIDAIDEEAAACLENIKRNVEAV